MTSTPGCGLRSFRRCGRPVPGTAGVPRSSAGTAAPGRSSPPCAPTGPSRRGRRDFRPHRDARRPLVPDEPATASRTSVEVAVGPPGGSRWLRSGGRYRRSPGGLRNRHRPSSPRRKPPPRALGWPVRAICEAAVAQYRAQAAALRLHRTSQGRAGLPISGRPRAHGRPAHSGTAPRRRPGSGSMWACRSHSSPQLRQIATQDSSSGRSSRRRRTPSGSRRPARWRYGHRTR